jgi:hypothetical protein
MAKRFDAIDVLNCVLWSAFKVCHLESVKSGPKTLRGTPRKYGSRERANLVQQFGISLVASIYRLRPIAFDRTAQEDFDLLVDLLAQPADLASLVT